jgi:hypothetical protein
MKNTTMATDRQKLLKQVAEMYFEGLRTKSFSLIPFSDHVNFRAPIAPGGVHHPLIGVKHVFEQWWQPLEPLLDGISIEVVDHYYNEDETGIISRADIVLKDSGIKLRVADRFRINEEGDIIEQENHFDASPLRG